MSETEAMSIMTTRLIRECECCLKLGIKPSLFRRDFVARRDAPSRLIPGLSIERLRPVPVGERIKTYAEDEVDAVVQALIALRDVKPAEQHAA